MSAALAAVPEPAQLARPSDALDPKSRLAWQGWSLAKEAKGVKASTLECYERAVCLLAASAGVPLTDVTAAQLRAWQVELTAAGRTASTRATYLRHVRNFYNWMVAQEYMTRSPALAVEQPQVPEHLPEVVSVRDVARLLAAIKGKRWQDKRDRAMIRLLFECGPRASELAGIRCGDIDIAGKHIMIREGKWGRDRLVPFSAKTGVALHAALMARPGTMTNESPFFVGSKAPHAPFTRSGVTQVLAQRCQLAGLGDIGPHRARHTAVSNFFEDGGSRRDAMAIFGWQSEIMASHYGKQASGRVALKHFHEMTIGADF